MPENETNPSNQTPPAEKPKETPPAPPSEPPKPTTGQSAPPKDENLEALQEAVSDMKDSLKIGDTLKATLETLSTPQQYKMLKALKEEAKSKKEENKKPKDPAPATNPAVPNPDVEPEYLGYLETNAREKFLEKLYEKAKPKGLRDIVP